MKKLPPILKPIAIITISTLIVTTTALTNSNSYKRDPVVDITVQSSEESEITQESFETVETTTQEPTSESTETSEQSTETSEQTESTTEDTETTIESSEQEQTTESTESIKESSTEPTEQSEESTTESSKSLETSESENMDNVLLPAPNVPVNEDKSSDDLLTPVTDYQTLETEYYSKEVLS